MALNTVYMTPQVHYACLLHALTVEKEEVMGMLIGKFDEENNAYIRATIALQRLDKRRDRVEISNDQMLAAMQKATELSEQYQDEVNVIGWYHSHPHTTVNPSAVDLRTQANWQVMEPRFVALIFSVFNEDKDLVQETQVTCFQTIIGNDHAFIRKDVPLIIEKTRLIEPACLNAVLELPRSISQEEIDSYNTSTTAGQDILSKIHNDAKFVSSMSHIMKTTMNPLMLHLEHRLAIAEHQYKMIMRERTNFMEKARARKRANGDQ